MGTDVPTAGRAYATALRQADRRQQARVLALLAVLVLFGGLAFSNTDDQLPPGVFAEVVRGQATSVDGAQTFIPGDLIEEELAFTVLDGEIHLRTNTGDVFLRDGASATGSRRVLRLDTGEAFLEGDYLGVTTPEFFASGSGRWRIDLGLNPRVALYDGAAAASSVAFGGDPLGVTVNLQPYQEARTAAGAPSGPFPIVYTASDAWDRRHLAELLAIDDEAASLAATVEARWGTDPRPASFYERFEVFDEGLLDALEQFATTGGAGTYGVPGDVLTAVFATRALVDAAGREPAVAIELVDDRRADGATWGVVLAMDDVGLDAFQAARDLGLRNEEVLPPLPPPSPTPSPSPTPTPTPTPTETDGPDPQPSECPDGQERQADGTCAEPGCPDGQERDADGNCVPVCPEGQERTPEGDCEDPREPVDCVSEPDVAECTVTNVIEEVLDVLPVLNPGPPSTDAMTGSAQPPLGIGSNRQALPGRAPERPDPPGRPPVLRLLLSVLWI